jgi:uncharacterized protein YkwD
MKISQLSLLIIVLAALPTSLCYFGCGASPLATGNTATVFGGGSPSVTATATPTAVTTIGISMITEVSAAPLASAASAPSPVVPSLSATALPIVSSAGTADLLTMEKQVKTQVDSERAREGKPALQWNDALGELARKHSQDMKRRDFFDHVNPDGLDPFARLKRAGITFSTAAENIAQNQGFPDPGNQAVIGWMNSDGHRGNILDLSNAGYTQTGVGIARKDDGTYFFTQVFIKP